MNCYWFLFSEYILLILWLYKETSSFSPCHQIIPRSQNVNALVSKRKIKQFEQKKGNNWKYKIEIFSHQFMSIDINKNDKFNLDINVW